jgi:hypothetical protein
MNIIMHNFPSFVSSKLYISFKERENHKETTEEKEKKKLKVRKAIFAWTL